MQRYQQIAASRKQIIFNNFLGGIAWGIGTIVGVALLFTIALPFLKQLDFIPVIGNFAVELAQHMQTHSQGSK